jgi:hypothetical protein
MDAGTRECWSGGPEPGTGGELRRIGSRASQSADGASRRLTLPHATRLAMGPTGTGRQTTGIRLWRLRRRWRDGVFGGRGVRRKKNRTVPRQRHCFLSWAGLGRIGPFSSPQVRRRRMPRDLLGRDGGSQVTGDLSRRVSIGRRVLILSWRGSAARRRRRRRSAIVCQLAVLTGGRAKPGLPCLPASQPLAFGVWMVGI